MSQSWRLLSFLMAVLIITGCAETYTPATTLEDFTKKHVEIINTKNRKAYLESFHQEVRAASAIFMIYFDRNFNALIEDKIPEDYQLRIQEISPTQPLPYEGQLKYVIRPTHQVFIGYAGENNTPKGLAAFAVQVDGVWWQVLPIPTFELLQKMKEEREKLKKK